MKKLFLLLILFVASTQLVNAQKCDCNANGFGPIQYTTNGATITVRDGHQFSIKCNQPFNFNSSYKCDYNNPICNVKLKATIKNSAGIVVKSFENFSFPLAHEFETGGNYILEVTPYCAGKACPSLKFYFNVLCDTQVDCKCDDKKGWNKLSSVLNKMNKPIKCGDTFNIKKIDKFGIYGNYKCIGDCDVILKGSIMGVKTTYNQSFPSIILDGTPLTFPGAGSYKLVVTPVCKNKECEPCVFYVNIN